MKALRNLVLTLLVLTLAVYLVAVIVPAVTFYRSAQRAERADLEALDAPLNKLGEVLKDKGSLSGFDDIINEKRKEIQADIADIRQANDKQVVVSRLESISASLSFIETRLGRERDKGGEAVKDLESKVAALKKKVGPADSWDRLLGTALERGGAILLTMIWPLGILGFLFYVLSAEGPTKRLRGLFQGVKSLEASATGLKVELADSEKAKTTVEDVFKSLRAEAKSKYDVWAERRSIHEKLENVVSDVLNHLRDNGKDVSEYRCTLHVPDIVIANTLYQLFDYLPARTTGGGRIFSVRFGLIGKVYRLQQAETLGTVPKASNGTVDKERLVREWGMTPNEVESAARRPPPSSASRSGTMITTPSVCSTWTRRWKTRSRSARTPQPCTT